MSRLTRLVLAHRVGVLIVWALIFLGSNVAAQLIGTTYSNSLTLPHTDSAAADRLLASVPGFGGAIGTVVLHSPHARLASDRAAISRALARVATLPGVAHLTAPACPPNAAECTSAPQVSPDQRTAYVNVTFARDGLHLNPADVAAVERALTGLRPRLDVYFGGEAFGAPPAPQNSPAEIIGLLVAAAVLLVAFGSLFAMALPLLVAIFAVGTASALTGLLSHLLTIATFAPILGSLIGLGVGIDYALFIVTRTRQDLRAGASVAEAVTRALDTSGRAVLFAGGTVVIALLGMLLLGQSLLSGIALSASLTVAVTVAAAITLLPALLSGEKRRVLSRRERTRLVEFGPDSDHLSGPWSRWAARVASHAPTFIAASLAVLVTLAVPLTALRLGNADQGSDPAGSSTRLAYDQLARAFGPGVNGPLSVVVRLDRPASPTQLTALRSDLARTPDVAAVSRPVALSPGLDLLTVVPASSPQSPATTTLIDTLRQRVLPAATHPLDAHAYVGGLTATYADFSSVLGGEVPFFIAVVVALGSLLLMVAFRSVLMPLVAATMNLLAASSAFGLVVAVFQWGWGASLLGTGTGPVDPFLPVIMIAILFGLSMDYQVFLVSRMHEEWLNTGDNEEAIVRGQANTGRVITAAALIMISVFLSFAFGGQRIIAEFGVGLGGAVLMDAFILRTVLVPSLMHFIGRANWWMPRWLDRIVPHVAVEATEDELAVDPSVP